jgi:hypothetical protein
VQRLAYSVKKWISGRVVVLAAIALGGAIGFSITGVTFAGENVPHWNANEALSVPARAFNVSLPAPSQIEFMRNRLLQGAYQSGEQHPTAGMLVTSTRHDFLLGLAGEDISDNRPIYVVAADGTFTLNDASTPGSDVPPPSGHFLFIAFDAKTLEGVDGGVLSAPPVDLSKLGTATPLDLRPSG